MEIEDIYVLKYNNGEFTVNIMINNKILSLTFSIKYFINILSYRLF